MNSLERNVALVFAALLFLGCGGTYEPTDQKKIALCYSAEFGGLPPAGTTNIQAKQIVIGDAVGAWLRFETTPATVDSLLKIGFAPTNGATFLQHSMAGANTPKWWKLEGSQVTSFYVFSGWRTNFSYSYAVIAHDVDKRLVYFCHHAFD